MNDIKDIAIVVLFFLIGMIFVAAVMAIPLTLVAVFAWVLNLFLPTNDIAIIVAATVVSLSLLLIALMRRN